MNGDASTPPDDADSVDLETATTPLVAALQSLFEQDERWRRIAMPGGATLTRGWEDDTVDTVVVLSPDTAYGSREDPRGREILRIRATAEQVIAAVRNWPAPSDPDAADGSGHLPGHSGLWTP